jgi:hypothetical protein
MSLIEQYVVAKKVLDNAREEELRLRKELIAPMIEGRLEGASSQEIEGYKVTATASYPVG